MQSQTPEAGGAKATTPQDRAGLGTTPQTRPRLASHSLDLPNHCDICKRARSHGNHQRCSRIRQTRQSAYWSAYMANVEAKRAQGDRRNAR